MSRVNLPGGVSGYNALKKKFPPKKPVSKNRSSKAAVKAIAREYELKKAEKLHAAKV